MSLSGVVCLSWLGEETEEGAVDLPAVHIDRRVARGLTRWVDETGTGMSLSGVVEEGRVRWLFVVVRRRDRRRGRWTYQLST
jgi:hypothetical protein